MPDLRVSRSFKTFVIARVLHSAANLSIAMLAGGKHGLISNATVGISKKVQSFRAQPRNLRYIERFPFVRSLDALCLLGMTASSLRSPTCHSEEPLAATWESPAVQFVVSECRKRTNPLPGDCHVGLRPPRNDTVFTFPHLSFRPSASERRNLNHSPIFRPNREIPRLRSG